jgi:membrane-associated protein
MNYRHFIAFNLVAAFSWGIALPLLGAWLGATFPFVEKNIDLIIIVIVLASITPMIVGYLRHRRSGSQAGSADSGESADKDSA